MSIQVQSGKLYENRTWKYLFPSLRLYDKELNTQLSKLFKLAVGIKDNNLIEQEKNCICILIDTEIRLSKEIDRINYRNSFSKFLDWVRYQNYYVKDYIFQDIDSGEKHMLVLKLPLDLEELFIDGKYSLLYDGKTINEIYPYINVADRELEKKLNDKLNNTRKILRKDKTFLLEFVNRVNSKFKTNVSEKYFLNAELDFPPKLTEETFN